MKKILLLIAMLMISLIATAQLDTSKMTNYEKYYYSKDKNVDTVIKKTPKVEYDDLYATSEDQKLVTTVFNRNKKTTLKSQPERELYSEGYVDGLQDAYDYYTDDPFYYSNTIYRFRYPFSYSWFYGYWRYPYYSYMNPFYYDYWYWDNWYYSYNNWWYPYHYWYSPNYYTYRVSRYPDYAYNSLGSRRYRSTLYNTTSRRRATISTSTPRITQETRRTGTITQNKSRTTERSYVPSYSNPRTTTRPMFNNTNPNRRTTISNSQRYNYNLPQVQSRPSTQTKNYSPSRSYSAPNRSSYSTPRNSYGGNYNSGSSVNRSSSGSSSNTTSGRRK